MVSLYRLTQRIDQFDLLTRTSYDTVTELTVLTNSNKYGNYVSRKYLQDM